MSQRLEEKGFKLSFVEALVKGGRRVESSDKKEG